VAQVFSRMMSRVVSRAAWKGRPKMKRALAILAVLLAGFSVSGQPHALTGSPAWESVAGPAGGSVAALAMSPDYASDHTVWAGLRGHGVYRSVDGGGTWQPLGLSDQVIVDLAVSPNFAVDHTLFAATGLGASGYMVYRSTDGGAKWQQPYVTPYADGFKPLIGLSISPNYGSDHTVYVLGTLEMVKSTDGGQVFTKMGGWYATHHVTALAFSPAFASDHTAFAAVQDNGIMKSLDSGVTWAAMRLMSMPPIRRWRSHPTTSTITPSPRSAATAGSCVYGPTTADPCTALVCSWARATNTRCASRRRLPTIASCWPPVPAIPARTDRSTAAKRGVRPAGTIPRRRIVTVSRADRSLIWPSRRAPSRIT
jgi:hypothetical protein